MSSKELRILLFFIASSTMLMPACPSIQSEFFPWKKLPILRNVIFLTFFFFRKLFPSNRRQTRTAIFRFFDRAVMKRCKYASTSLIHVFPSVYLHAVLRECRNGLCRWGHLLKFVDLLQLCFRSDKNNERSVRIF
jgi:hypothetical protein